jgi:hypothetical protein
MPVFTLNKMASDIETGAKALASTTILTEKYDMYFLLNALECEQIPKYLIVIFRKS